MNDIIKNFKKIDLDALSELELIELKEAIARREDDSCLVVKIDREYQFTPMGKALIYFFTSNGDPLHRICKELKLRFHVAARALKNDIEFYNEIQAARNMLLEHKADLLETAHEDIPDTAKAHLFSANLKFLLSKRLPKIYGDVSTLNINQTVNLRESLENAAKRVFETKAVSRREEDEDIFE